MLEGRQGDERRAKLHGMADRSQLIGPVAQRVGAGTVDSEDVVRTRALHAILVVPLVLDVAAAADHAHLAVHWN